MIVVCKRPTRRLVKGARYETGSLWNDGTNQRWQEGRVEIVGIGIFVVDNFTDDNGNPLPKTNIIVPRQTVSLLQFEEVKKGDILVCTSDSYKTLGKGCMYQVEQIKQKSEQRQGWNGQPFNRIEQTIKFVGIPRTLKFSSWRFRKLTAQESREIQLNSVLLGEEPNITKTKDIRKFDLVSNKNLELMNAISKSILDPSRHVLSIIDWACQKSSNQMGLTQDDFSQILNLPLKDILAIIETK